MPYPKEVKVAGKVIKEVEEVSIKLTTGSSGRGYWEKRTGAAEVTLRRRARNKPTEEWFQFATNGDGRAKPTTGSVTLQTAALKEIYKIEMKVAYISNWKFEQPAEDGDLIEEITLSVGELEFWADGKTGKFKVPQFQIKK